MEKYPQIKSENTKAGEVLKKYQAEGANSNLISFMRRNGINTSFLVLNMVVSYNGGDFLDLVDKSVALNLSRPHLDQIGLTVAEKDGML